MLNRFELGALGGDGRYKKIIPNVMAIESLLIEEGVRAIPRKSKTHRTEAVLCSVDTLSGL